MEFKNKDRRKVGSASQSERCDTDLRRSPWRRWGAGNNVACRYLGCRYPPSQVTTGWHHLFIHAAVPPLLLEPLCLQSLSASIVYRQAVWNLFLQLCNIILIHAIPMVPLSAHRAHPFYLKEAETVDMRTDGRFRGGEVMRQMRDYNEAVWDKEMLQEVTLHSYCLQRTIVAQREAVCAML